MELKQLATLVKIAELGSFSAAAVELGYTQSTVTMQIQALERDLDAPLFDRIGRSVHLTENGRVAVLAARKMLEEARRLRLTLAEGEGGLVRIGVYESLCGAFLPGMIVRFREEFPQAELRVVTASRRELMDLLAQDRIDLIWVYGEDFPETVRTLAEFQHPVSLIAAPGGVAVGQSLVLEALLAEPLIYTEPGCPYRRLLEGFLTGCGQQPEVFLEAGSTSVVLEFVQAGLGIGFLPDFLTGEAVTAGRLIRFGLEEFTPRLMSRVCCHRDKWVSPAMEAVAELARRAVT